MTEIYWNVDFQVSSVTRVDLVIAGFPRVVAQNATDDDMREITSAMSDLYHNKLYWEHLELCAKRVLYRPDTTTTEGENNG